MRIARSIGVAAIRGGVVAGALRLYVASFRRAKGSDSKKKTVPTGVAVFCESDFPTLSHPVDEDLSTGTPGKRGANKRCAYGAFHPSQVGEISG
jgi:hypothetical protein